MSTVAGGGPGFVDGRLADARFHCPRGVAVASDAVELILYVADESNGRIRRIQGGVVTTLVGGGGSAAASVACPRGLHLDDERGRLFFTSSDNRVRVIAVPPASERRAARALPMIRLWTLVQRGRAHFASIETAAVGIAESGAAVPRVMVGGREQKAQVVGGCGESTSAQFVASVDSGGSALQRAPRTSARMRMARQVDTRRANDVLRLLAECPVVGVLARVLSFVSGDNYGDVRARGGVHGGVRC